ncbi:Pumilio domain-containing protein C6G9.14 [Ceratocystis platani]|uniref:Pumilio domain-containing protein C6G9.14 n=1 Tax=Ceratocystis fimbriata f. sp. platani TaxID=88771 RepID=A0A0F8B8J1_CERFI|nr:Pumilio domain-containing protein C6G9.14 [Ceratocystis platani]
MNSLSIARALDGSQQQPDYSTSCLLSPLQIAYQKVQLIEKKRAEYERLREQRRRFEAEMQRLDESQRREELELAQLTEEVHQLNGHQSEPTTPPHERYDSAIFPGFMARPNRYSMSNVASPPGYYSRLARASLLQSHHQGLGLQRTIAWDDPAATFRSVPVSRRNSDDEEREDTTIGGSLGLGGSSSMSGRYDAINFRPTSTRTNRYSMPSASTGQSHIRMLASDMDGLDQANTARFLFGNETTSNSHLDSDYPREPANPGIEIAPSKPTTANESLGASDWGFLSRTRSSFGAPSPIGPSSMPNSFRRSLDLKFLTENSVADSSPGNPTPISPPNGAIASPVGNMSGMGMQNMSINTFQPNQQQQQSPVHHQQQQSFTPAHSNTQPHASSVQAPPTKAQASYPSPTHGRDSQARVIQSRRQQENDVNNKYNNLPLEAVIGQIYQLCKDQHGCRYLQRRLEEHNPDITHAIWTETNQHVVELMTDPFGNYLCQKLLESCSEEERTTLIRNASHEMVPIALNQHGTRALQKMIEFVHTDVQIALIVDALRFRVVELIQNINGNHVIQKCLNKLKPEDAQFIFDAVGHNCVDVGTHRHGCCVLQRCIDHANEKQQEWLIARITEDANVLVQDPYGNYVVQYIIDLNEPNYTEPMVVQFRDSIGPLSRHKFSSNVIEKCIRCASDVSKDMIVEELLNPAELERCLRDGFANYVVQTALDYATPAKKSALIDAIRPILPSIRSTPHGRRIGGRINNMDTRGMTSNDGTGGQTALQRSTSNGGSTSGSGSGSGSGSSSTSSGSSSNTAHSTVGGAQNQNQQPSVGSGSGAKAVGTIGSEVSSTVTSGTATPRTAGAGGGLTYANGLGLGSSGNGNGNGSRVGGSRGLRGGNGASASASTTTAASGNEDWP